MKLFRETKELLADRPASLTYLDIEKATGIKESWLRMFSCGRIRNPGVNTVEALHDFLKSIKA